MKRINMAKYGFIRTPEDDFTDDSNRFQCYQAGEYENVRISKLVSDGQVYLSAQAQCNLPYEIYGKFPSYQTATWTYNGVDLESLTDEDLRNFYKACCAYAQECIDADATAKYPTIEEITEQCEKLFAKSSIEYATAQRLVADAVIDGSLINLLEYEWNEIRSSLKALKNTCTNYDPKSYPQKLVGKSSSFDFVKPTYHYLNNKSFYLAQIEKYIHRIRK